MFKQLKNIDSAFKHIRLFSIILITATSATCCFVVYKSQETVRKMQNRVYFISNGKLLDAVAIDRKEVLSVQLRKHVETFHYFFYSLEPDDDLIKKNVTKALYLADDAAKTEYDNLREQGYYASIVSGNISQRIETDSISINTSQAPYSFIYYGKLKIIRPTSITTRSLVTEGRLRPLQTVSDNNPYGFLIERWRIIENKDINVEKR